jgi:hypothetical protein
MSGGIHADEGMMCRCTGYGCPVMGVLLYADMAYTWRPVDVFSYMFVYIDACVYFRQVVCLQLVPYSALYAEVVTICLRCLTALFQQRARFDSIFLFQCLHVDCTAVWVDSARDWELDGADVFGSVRQRGAWGRRLARWLPPWMYVHPSC